MELCPYASTNFSLAVRVVVELTATDLGFQTAAEVTRVLLDRAKLGLVLVNGSAALEYSRRVASKEGGWLFCKADLFDKSSEHYAC